ncbi:MAG: hypothetical protein ACRC9G_03455 [Aeromonas veronii]
MGLLRLICDLVRPVSDSVLESRGYEYAKGQLAKGVSEDELEAQVSVFDRNAFDCGIERALRDAHQGGDK